MVLSKLCEEVKPSAIRKMFNKAEEYENVISFTLGEPDYTASPNVVEAGCAAIRQGKTKYTANAGVLNLRESISRYLYQLYAMEYEADSQIIVTPGAMGALYLAMKAILNQGDEVILCDPGWTNYAQQVIMNGAVPVFVQVKEENDFMLDMEELKEKVSDRTRCILLNSPCNPTGAILSHENLLQIAKLAVERDLIVIFDEVYKQIRYEEKPFESICMFPGMKERTVLVDSFSKSYAMTGWRIGYAAGPGEIIKNMVKFQESISACAVMSNQYAAIEALDGSQEFLQEMVRNYKKRRDLVQSLLEEIPGLSCKKAKGTFYAFLNIKDTGLASEEFATRLLEEKQVVVVPGTAFGDAGEGYIRISYATSEDEIREGMRRIREFVDALEEKKYIIA